jgi:hypothetical protein
LEVNSFSQDLICVPCHGINFGGCALTRRSPAGEEACFESSLVFKRGAVHRGVYLPSLTNSFRERRLEVAYQRYSHRQRQKSLIIANAVDLLLKVCRRGRCQSLNLRNEARKEARPLATKGIDLNDKRRQNIILFAWDSNSESDCQGRLHL